MLVTIIILGFLVTAVTGLPIGLGLALTGLSILHFVVGDATDLALNAVWSMFTDFTLSAVPLFIIMGEIMLASGVSARLYTAVAPFFNRLPGRLLHTNVAVSTIFGAVSGASTSTAAAVGSVAYPELIKRGYDVRSVTGSLAAGGTLGLLIPPSLALLIYGATQQVSIGKLFLAGIIPGILFAIMFMGWIVISSLRETNDRTDGKEAPSHPKGAFYGLMTIWPIGFLVFAVLGTIYLGLATPTEAAGLGVAASIILGFAWGELTLASLYRALVHGVQVFVSIGIVILGAVILSQAMQILGLPYMIMNWVNGLGFPPTAILAAVAICYLVLGCFFDGTSLMLMTLPVVFPTMMALGYDPVWLGVVITVLIEVGMLTPPVGLNLYILCGISGNKVSLVDAARAAFPYWILLLFGVVLLVIFPGLATFLPNLAY